MRFYFRGPHGGEKALLLLTGATSAAYVCAVIAIHWAAEHLGALAGR